MKRMAALCGALLLTLALAAPAAANEKVWIPEHSGEWAFEEPISIAAGWDFQCSGSVYYGGYGSYDLWLWYPNGLSEAEMKPEGRAWPWIKGQGIGQGLDYFSSQPDMGGKVISGKWKVTDHSDRHYLGSPYPTDDLETWRLTMTGKAWGIQAPGYGTVFHVSGKERGTVTVIEQVPGPYDLTTYDPDDPERWHQGNETYDVEALCAYFGYEAVYP